MEINNRPELKFADVSKNGMLYGCGYCPKDDTFFSNVWLKLVSKYTGKEYMQALFCIYSYTVKGGVRIWGLSSPKFGKPRFYKDYETALKWAGILYDQMEIAEEYDVRRTFKVCWSKNIGGKKAPVWEDHEETAFYYKNPAFRCSI